MSAAKRFERFLAQHGPAVESDTYYWCSGPTWESRRYCAMVVVWSKADPTVRDEIELNPGTARSLVRQLQQIGYRMDVTTVARLCEHAARSPKRPPDNKVLKRRLIDLRYFSGER
jgi:hypothetical protein